MRSRVMTSKGGTGRLFEAIGPRCGALDQEAGREKILRDLVGGFGIVLDDQHLDHARDHSSLGRQWMRRRRRGRPMTQAFAADKSGDNPCHSKGRSPASCRASAVATRRAAHDGDAEGTAQLRPDPRAERQRQGAEQGAERRHDDRPEAQHAGLDDGVMRRQWPARSAWSAKSIIMMAFFLTMPIRG